MPEGPETRRVADRLASAIGGKRLIDVYFGLDHLEHHADELVGRRVESVTSRGKALLTRFDSGRVLYSHNQLYGRWVFCAPDQPPATTRSLRVSLQTKSRWALLYSASDIELLNEDELRSHTFLARLGPDILDAETTPAAIQRRLRDDRFRRRSLASLLLDQSFLAGVGNYLRTEALFFAGLAPQVRAQKLSDGELAQLARSVRRVARRSYTTGGVTEEAAFVKDAKRDGQSRRQWRHAAFGREGEPCRRCGTTIERHEIAGRRLYTCAACQPAS